MTVVVGHPSTATQKKERSLRGVHRTSTAQSHDDVGIHRPGKIRALSDFGLGGIFVDAVKNHHIIEQIHRPRDMTCGNNPRIGHDENFPSNQ